MPRSRTTASVLTCDICGFKVSNLYIFKRHLHKCYTLHGIASKRSTPRHPVRIKGTEGIRSSDYKGPEDPVLNSEGKVETTETPEKDPVKDEAKQPSHSSGLTGDDGEGSIGSVSSSHWGVTNSPQVAFEVTAEKKEDELVSEFETPSPKKARFERKYACGGCQFETLNSRSYLYHLRDVHGERLNIFECHLCDYASRYNNKLARHMSVHRKPGEPPIAPPDSSIVQNQRLRVKPLKLKRLSVQTSPEFEVSPPIISPKLQTPSGLSPSGSSKASISPSAMTSALSPTMIKSDIDAAASKADKREVFKMILAEDGSHHYQCRSCLFYANTAHSVKKHFVLCHCKILQCSYCKYSTTEQAEYYEHILTHSGPGKMSFIKCEDCSYVTNARSNYEKHRSFHGADAPFHCTVCNFAAESESKVKRHMATQHVNQISGEDVEEGPMDMDTPNVDTMGQSIKGKKLNHDPNLLIKYRCPQCPVVCLRRGNFTRHLVARHNFSQKTASATSKSMERRLMRKGNVPNATPSAVPAQKRRQLLFTGDCWKCSECSYTAKWPSDLRRHRQVHTLVKRFKCSMCNNKYKYLGDLNVHMRRDHMTEPLNIMAKDFVSTDVVRKASPASFRCPICPFTTYSKSDLEQHSKLHKDIEKTFRCRLCDYQTYWRGDVGRHLFRHHSILLGKDSQEIETYFIHRPEIRPLTKKPLNLDNASRDSLDSSVEHYLGGKESSPGNVYRNPALVSRKEGQFPCNYPDCDYRTTTQERLESHCAYHENLKQFMCPTCGKRTNWKWDVVKHMIKVHKNPTATNDDVITLPIEEARATISDYLSQWDKKPAGILVYLCSLCDFTSGDKARVENHLDINHKDENGSVLSSLKSHNSSDSMSMDNSREAEEPGSMDDIKMDLFVDPPAEELAKVDKPFACAICKKAEVSKAEVKKHYNYAHPYKDIHVIYTVDGTEFDYNTNEIYCKKTDSPLESGDQSSLKFVRPDSKYSNPRMHGYVKPFKCSICGLRSNWKWDLKKHLRAKHPSKGGFVIMLSIAEAKSTYSAECSPSHPREENKQPKYKEPSSDFVTSPTSSSFKHPFSVKGEPYDTNYGIFGSVKSPPGDRATTFDPNRRQWKCSGCSYISNWRRNMARHIQRHHTLEKGKIRVIALHLLNKDIQQKFLKEQRLGQSTKPFKDIVMKGEGNQVGSCRLWHCPKCPYQSNLRTHIIVHMQKHGMKPFSCMVCNSPFMNRGPLHKHIQRVHRRSDHIKLCKVNIDYGDGPNDHEDSVFICCVCQLESPDWSVVENHLVNEHQVKEPDYYIVRMPKNRNERTTAPKSPVLSPEQRNRTRKTHFCQLCPYRSQKKSMLSFHMSYHKPTPTNRFKCKFCPYYVSTTRLLHQHQRKWHSEKRRVENVVVGSGWEQGLTTPPASPLKHVGRTEQTSGSSRRHFCEKCPYTTNSKNDFIYHKQFHRPKRTAEFKCEYCDYWVVHKRLLKQHMRLHTQEATNEVEVSPAKSVCSDPGLVYDPIELTELAAIKQQMISAKITPSLSKSPKFSPMKMATKLSVDNKPGYVFKNGLYRKLHKCRKCPYTNIRARNMQLHEMMHGPRQCSYPLMKCPYCDYYVGSKGLLSHHMKVHSKNYGDTPENDALMNNLTDDEDASDTEIETQQKVDTLLTISRFKRYGCEKCPYASAKRQHFERHLELHGSRQRYTCQYCDYSVPSSCLLNQHSRLHLMPNQNLLASQSINNLQFVSEVPADVALASALPPTDRDMPVTISVIHDHLGLYENSIYDAEPKKLYRCDRCPYANVRRDYLLSHLKFHMVSSSMVCPYCDYSAPKQTLLIQHIRVHFCPLPELSDWLLENGQMERETTQRNIDLAEALKVAHEYQNQSKKKSKVTKPEAHQNGGNDENTEEKENMEDGQNAGSQQTLICQYCDREFSSSEKLVKHELQHLIGNQFEMALKSVSEDQQQNGSSKKSTKSNSKKGVNGARESSKKELTDSGDLKGVSEAEIIPAKKEPTDNGDMKAVSEAEIIPEAVSDDLLKFNTSTDESFKLELSINTDISEDLDQSNEENLQESPNGTDSQMKDGESQENDHLVLDISMDDVKVEADLQGKDDKEILETDGVSKNKADCQEMVDAEEPKEMLDQGQDKSVESDDKRKDDQEETDHQMKVNRDEKTSKEKDCTEERNSQEKNNIDKINDQGKESTEEKVDKENDNPKDAGSHEKVNTEERLLKKEKTEVTDIKEKDKTGGTDIEEKDTMEETDNQEKENTNEKDNQQEDKMQEKDDKEDDNLKEDDETQVRSNSQIDNPQEDCSTSDLKAGIESLKENDLKEGKEAPLRESLNTEVVKNRLGDLKEDSEAAIEMNEKDTPDKGGPTLLLKGDTETIGDLSGDGGGETKDMASPGKDEQTGEGIDEETQDMASPGKDEQKGESIDGETQDMASPGKDEQTGDGIDGETQDMASPGKDEQKGESIDRETQDMASPGKDEQTGEGIDRETQDMASPGKDEQTGDGIDGETQDMPSPGKDEQTGDGIDAQTDDSSTGDTVLSKVDASDTKQGDEERKTAEKTELKDDRKDEPKMEIGDVFDEIEKVLEDVEMPSPEEKEVQTQEGDGEQGK